MATTAALLLLPGLGDYGYWDPFELDIVQRALQQQSNPASPVSQWLVERAVEYAGFDEWTTRLPLAIVGILTAVVSYIWIARTYSTKVAVGTAVLLMSSPLFLFHSRFLVSALPTVATQLLLFVGVSEFIHGQRWRVGAGAVSILSLALSVLSGGAIVGGLTPLIALALTCGVTKRWRMCLVLSLTSLVFAVLTVYLGIEVGGAYKAMPANASWDVLFEQIVFGTFPWIVFVPAALFALSHNSDREQFTNTLALTWIGASIGIGSLYSFHIHTAMFSALPALAFVVSRWLWSIPTAPAMPRQQVIVFGLLALMIARDLSEFSQRLSAIHLPIDTLQHGEFSPIFPWFAFATTVALILFLVICQSASKRQALPWGILGTTLLFGSVFSQYLLPSLSKNVSHSHIVREYLRLKKGNEPIRSLGPVPSALALYVPSAKPTNRHALNEELQSDSRVFALVPRASVCPVRQLSRKKGIDPAVLVQNNTYALLSNQHSPDEKGNTELSSVLGNHQLGLGSGPKELVFDDSIRLHSVQMPKRVKRGTEFTLRLEFEVLKRTHRKWKVFAHFDGPGIRFQGDHWPIEDRCGSNYWNPGDVVIDTYTIKAGDSSYPAGRYQLWAGFFFGSQGNWTRAQVTEGIAVDNRARIADMELF